MQIKTHIQGIPCVVDVTHFDPGRPAITAGRPDDWAPPELPELEYDVLTLGGHGAGLLARIIRQEDRDRIYSEVVAATQQAAYEARISALME